MISEFNWWLLLLGLVVGGGLTWLVLAETRRREQDLEEQDLADEAVWLEERLAEEGRPLSAGHDRAGRPAPPGVSGGRSAI